MAGRGGRPKPVVASPDCEVGCGPAKLCGPKPVGTLGVAGGNGGGGGAGGGVANLLVAAA